VQLIVCRRRIGRANMDDGIAPLNTKRIGRTPRVARDTEELHPERSARNAGGLAGRQWETLTDRDGWSSWTPFVTRRHEQETKDYGAGDKWPELLAHDSSLSNAHAIVLHPFVISGFS
jgi:hypothetical protein